MALVRKYGKPDVFLTMTCNPNWEEIKRELEVGQIPQDRPDLAVRVFRAKLEEMKRLLLEEGILGKVQAYVYVVEFQKRGLPHAHFLLIMQGKYKLTCPEQYDSIISTELPDKCKYLELYKMVIKHMMHGPCGILNPECPCTKASGKCRNHYPRPFNMATLQGKDSYPVYRRREDGRKQKVRGHELDNRWVVPYNPFLLRYFNCHVNVEVCSSIKAVKYLYKYLYKGHDHASVSLNEPDGQGNVDEIKMHREARWVTPLEALWRIYGFELSKNNPPVMQLQLHLPGMHMVTYEEGQDIQEILDREGAEKSMLTEYFEANKKNPVILYPGATSFEDLRIVDGEIVPSFREAAERRGLIEADNTLDDCLAEAETFQMPSALRRLFATILVHCEASNVRSLWDKHQEAMSEDYCRTKLAMQAVQNMVLIDIRNMLQSMGKDIKSYPLPEIDEEHDSSHGLDREIYEESIIEVNPDHETLATSLNAEQRSAYDEILTAVDSGEGGVFFVDGPGGTGKTFLYKALLATVRGMGNIAVATATSGVAASILPGGRTAHSQFKIPLTIYDGLSCSFTKQSGTAKLLKEASLIIWDEATMTRRQAAEALDNSMRDIMNAQDRPFGGKTIVFGGDFRQVLPIIRKGSRAQIVDSSLRRSYLWECMRHLKLVRNMRAQSDPWFAEYLLRVGNGTEEDDGDGYIHLLDEICVPYTRNDTDLHRLIEDVFPMLDDNMTDPDYMTSRAILSTRNDCVDRINMQMIHRFRGEEMVYHSFDRADDDPHNYYPLEFLNSLTPNGLPPHVLRLKINCPVILLRNIDPANGLCNGTRLIVRGFQKNAIDAEIVLGQHARKRVFLPRIPLCPSDDEMFPFWFKRKQFPIRLSFAMTINKAQGQTIPHTGVYLPEPVFSHGQLYVALSRATARSNIKVLAAPDDKGKKNKKSRQDKTKNNRKQSGTYTKNIVYKEVLRWKAKIPPYSPLYSNPASPEWLRRYAGLPAATASPSSSRVPTASAFTIDRPHR
ncbi:hypothetical protein U9M48_032832 [Paspalum notatum var. saurae]|uniref:ATP-dependent DNA helicase n=1 Tax=Paspalum notatum var. saurae TaxID=547442 RepID=A0AAQ3U5I9_PASNO